MTPVFLLPELKSLAKGLGLTVVGYAGVSASKKAKNSLRLWQEAGFAGSMNYMNREVELLSEATRLLPSAKSVLMFSLHYDSSPHPPLKPGYGRVARYAWGRDYHSVMREKLKNLLTLINDSSIEARVFSDSVPLLERAFGKEAGLGFVGKNTLLIRPRTGSFFFLGEIVWNAEVVGDFPIIEESCGSCERCLKGCPTDAFVAPYSLDARKCISYLTIEKRGMLNFEERRAIGEWVFGCDVCQDVCPYNHTPIKESREGAMEFSDDLGVGPLLDLKHLLSIKTDEEFLNEFGRSPITRAGRNGLIRNAICVAVNTKAKDLRPQILDCLSDSSEIIRSHAEWGAKELQ